MAALGVVGRPCRSVRPAMLQTEARSAEHRADAGRSTAPATGGCDGHSALRPSWHSVIPHNRNSAMVSDNGVRPMIPDDHGRAMITHDGWRAMVADHETAAIVAAVASRRSVVGGNENQTGGERDGNSGRCCDTGFHEWAPLLQVRSLRRAPSEICERDHRQNVSALLLGSGPIDDGRRSRTGEGQLVCASRMSRSDTGRKKHFGPLTRRSADLDSTCCSLLFDTKRKYCATEPRMPLSVQRKRAFHQPWGARTQNVAAHTLQSLGDDIPVASGLCRRILRHAQAEADTKQLQTTIFRSAMAVKLGI
jgi:hypothetical protein